MSTSKDPRGNRYPHLDRAAIARAALALVDREGAAALTVRRLAAELGVAAMTLYHYVPSREAVVADVVGLVVDEMDLSVAPGLTWPEGARQVGRSLRAAALRHPRAFELVAVAPSDEPPLLEFALRLRAFYVRLGVPAGAFEEVWSVLDAFETGFLLLETQALLRASTPAPALAGEDLAGRMPAALTEAAYEEGLDIIIDGLRRRLSLSAGGRGRRARSGDDREPGPA